jgi:hypothetical protein
MIRQKGAIFTTQDALKLAIEQDRDKILDEAIVFRYKPYYIMLGMR